MARGSSIQYKAATLEDHRQVVQKLRGNNVPFYTYSTREDAQKRFVAKGIPTYYDDDIIQEELTALGIQVSKVVRLKSRREATRGQPIQAVQVTTSKTTTMDQLQEDASHFRNYKVNWEKFKGSGLPPLCSNCQGIGHSANTCSLPATCAICSGKHDTESCREKIRNNTPVTRKCSNCPDGPDNKHQANWKKCPTLLAYLKRQEERRPKKPQKFTPAPPPKTNAWAKRREDFPSIQQKRGRSQSRSRGATQNPTQQQKPIPAQRQNPNPLHAEPTPADQDFNEQFQRFVDHIIDNVPNRKVDSANFLRALNTFISEMQSGDLHRSLRATSNFIKSIN